MNLAIIPARGGSKRIPAKNIRDFAGKPLIAYSIQAAQEANLFDKIWVSTDSQEVADIAIKYGAEVPFLRPENLSNDVIGTRPVTNHGIQYCIDNFEKPEFCCCIYATAPFLQAEYLQKGLVSLQQDKDKSFSFAVTSFAFPIQRAISVQQGIVEPMFKQDIFKRSQDLEEAYHDAGQFYWGRTDDYLSKKGIFSQHSVPIVLPRHLVQDIDTPEDWQRAELMYQAYVKGI
ncbi:MULTISPECIES: pseudaminic acid cytidylyltransferase [Alteromonadaceae]|uniref:pseudaminic acid cytidylyltransferase n=1 Tax=Alteromonadaceae TaxID=72275 RepID=UPI001C093204|nr:MULTISPECIES: pseudaminic acid cytidylyltransferase [Aliiglaciecola]MBU2877987.1 pseudaminic acid cytidylyltransferase [Aliiglaciecola lipolytica]MDO6709352.1 pseudaminic acid cytidylyltransferase [Aliiglaciecola sp. 2_MG-2023]MDO6750500.1 pseudaminic acid cytidylyltransferase [Aliiglaciecola sp. 1_MG-2023]